jgi:hypothetical protein
LNVCKRLRTTWLKSIRQKVLFLTRYSGKLFENNEVRGPLDA